MAFSRSNPSDKSRNDRTMDIKAMRAVVDTLDNEIQQAKNKVYELNKFALDPSEYRGEQKNKKIQLESTGTINSSIAANVDSTQAAFASKFNILQMLSYQSNQNAIYQLTLNQLRSYQSSYENLKVNTEWRTNRIAKYWVEIHKKVSLPLACIIFVLIGAPIGMYTKKGNLGYAALISAGFLTFFWISIIQGEKLADRLVVSPFTGMWFSNILLGIIGGVMVLQMCTSFRISNLWKRRE
jgi:lipopolysaccharide export system permease protein